jgi:hypothetical protein
VVVSGVAWCVLGWWFREREVAAPAAG